MLVDVVVRKGEVIAARPKGVMPPPIIMTKTIDGYMLPTIRWSTASCDTLNTRLQKREFGRLKGKALEKAFKVVRENGGLDIAGEYGSIEVQESDFEVDLEIQKQRHKEMVS